MIKGKVGLDKGTLVLQVLRNNYDDYVRQNVLRIIEKCRRRPKVKKKRKVWGKKRCSGCGKFIKWKAKICRKCYNKKGLALGRFLPLRVHGTSRSYIKGCRCKECKEYKRVRNKGRHRLEYK